MLLRKHKLSSQNIPKLMEQSSGENGLYRLYGLSFTGVTRKLRKPHIRILEWQQQKRTIFGSSRRIPRSAAVKGWMLEMGQFGGSLPDRALRIF